MATLITDDDLAAWVNVTEPAKAPLVAAANLGATTRIQNYCARQFLPVTSSARYFEPLGATLCPIDDATAISAVATDVADDGQWSTVWATTDWYAAPVGGIGAAGQSGWPFTSILACEARWFMNTIRPNVKVTAVWGWAAIPGDVQLAARILGAELYKLSQTPLGSSWTAEGGDLQVIRDNRPIRDLLQPYKRANSTDSRFMVA